MNNQHCTTHGYQDHTDDGKCPFCERERELVEACMVAEQTLRSLALGDLVGDSREIALNAAIRLWRVVEGRK